MIGTLLGNRYEILQKIGEGGMAEVYKAKCHLLNRFVAVKVLKEEYSRDKDFVDKFKAEAAAAGSLTHSNIVNIYDVGSQENINYIVMEYIDGKTLKEYIIQSERLDYNRALDVAIQIAKALECAHKNGIIHRDIKPQNILVTDDGIVKVTDFGIAKAANSVTITNTNKVMGSAHYFSPEQARGSFVDARTDIYSLGVVLYEMVTGRVPYDAESPVSVALKHLQEPVLPPNQINNNIPEGLNNLILKAMQKEPTGRYNSIKDMQLDLQKIKNNAGHKIDLVNSLDDYTKIMAPVTNIDTEEDVDKEESKLSTKKLILILIPLVILVIAVGSFAGWYYMDRKSTPNAPVVKDKEVTIPTITGLTEAEASEAVKAKGLKLLVLGQEKSDKPAGTVIAVSPEEGKKVNTNTEVRVYLSAGQGAILVPNVKDLDVLSASKLIENNSFIVGKKDFQYSDTVPENSVISQTPAAGSEADKNTKIDLVISKGKEIKYTTVPDLRGRSLTEAENLLASVKLKMGNKTPIETSNSAENGKIVNQSPNPNTQNIKEGSAVDISYKVYKEPEKVELPDFVSGKNIKLKDAMQRLKELGFEVVTTGDPENVVTSQSPAAGPVAKGAKVTLKAEPPVVDKPAQ